MNIVTTRTITVPLSLSESAMPLVRRALNMAIVGQENVNRINKKGEMVAIHFSKEKLKKLEEAHHTVKMGRRISITFDITDTGEWINYRIKDT